MEKRKADAPESEKCSFGDNLNDGCHKKMKTGLQCFENLSDKDQSIYKWRAGIINSDVSITSICHYHEYKFGEYFKTQFNKCCNIYNKHSKKKVKGGHVISLEMAIKLKNNNYDVVPGWQLCRGCYEISKHDDSDSDKKCD